MTTDTMTTDTMTTDTMTTDTMTTDTMTTDTMTTDTMTTDTMTTDTMTTDTTTTDTTTTDTTTTDTTTTDTVASTDAAAGPNDSHRAPGVAMTDLRPALARAQEWVAGLIAGVRPDQLGDPTPCPEFDVASLIGHLYTGAARVRVIAEGGDALAVAPVTQLPGREPQVIADGYRARVRAAQRAWAARPDLTGPVRAPWGEVPAAAAIGNFLGEVLAHGWDLAVATGQPAEADADLAGWALQAARRGIPAGPRDGLPFAPVVASSADATPTEQFVNWMGRDAAWQH